MVEEACAEEFEPGLRVWFGAVDETKGGGDFPVEKARYVIEHSGAL